MNKETYNGWTNYATWRVNLEIFDGVQFVKEDFISEGKLTVADLAGHLPYVVENAITEGGEIKDGLTLDYARAFLADVNYYEIAESLVESQPELLD